MIGTILLILAIWFLISVPFCLLLGRFLAMSNHPLDRDFEMDLLEGDRKFSQVDHTTHQTITGQRASAID